MTHLLPTVLHQQAKSLAIRCVIGTLAGGACLSLPGALAGGAIAGIATSFLLHRQARRYARFHQLSQAEQQSRFRDIARQAPNAIGFTMFAFAAIAACGAIVVAPTIRQALHLPQPAQP